MNNRNIFKFPKKFHYLFFLAKVTELFKDQSSGRNGRYLIDALTSPMMALRSQRKQVSFYEGKYAEKSSSCEIIYLGFIEPRIVCSWIFAMFCLASSFETISVLVHPGSGANINLVEFYVILDRIDWLVQKISWRLAYIGRFSVSICNQMIFSIVYDIEVNINIFPEKCIACLFKFSSSSRTLEKFNNQFNKSIYSIAVRNYL